MELLNMMRGRGHGRQRPGLLLLGLLGFCVCVLPAAAYADVFELKDGRTVTGTVLYESDTFLSVRTTSGEIVTVERAEIVEQRKKQDKYQEYLTRKKKVASDDIPGHLALADWCLTKELFEESLLHLRKVLSVDPHHAQAREKLGYVKIKGDWYIEGSPEAAAARVAKKTEKVIAPPIELPDDYVEKRRKKHKKKPRTSGGSYGSGPRVFVQTKERVSGDTPEFSVATYEINSFLRTLDKPFSSTTSKESADFVVKISINVSFLRTHMFYGRIPISHIFNCSGSMTMKDKSTGRTVARITNLQLPFSMSARRDKKSVAEAGYHWMVGNLMNRVSKLSYFKKRGAKEIEEPNW
ncbi:MAG: hypothetical protein AAF581_12310 [Planctomycetota bacterium]